MSEIKIRFAKPYAFDKNLGRAFNEECRLADKNDWICLMDGDSMFLRSDYGHIAKKYIETYPNTALFVPITNRVGKKSHCYQSIRSEDPNILNHKRIADTLVKQMGVKNMNHVTWPSMPCFLFSKKTWEKVGGFDETGRILGVDVRFSQKVMKHGDCLRMNGLYLFHYYRMLEGWKSKKHLQ